MSAPQKDPMRHVKQSELADQTEPVTEEVSTPPNKCNVHGSTLDGCVCLGSRYWMGRARTAEAQIRRLLSEAESVAALKYDITHRGSGPPSDYDPDIYQLEKVTATGWWRFVHAVRDILKAKKQPPAQPQESSPFCLDCGHPLTESDRQAPVCPYCGAP